jgi:hypothetical protein
MKKKNEISLKVKSSSGEPYDVVFANLGTSFTVFCPCPAGIYGKLCKHKVKLLRGEKSILYNSSDISTLQIIQTWISSSPYSQLIEEYESTKNEIEAIKHKEEKIRQNLEKAMKEGIPFQEKSET